MPNVRFNLKHNKGDSLILLKFRYQRGRLPFVYSTGQKITTKFWDKKTMRAKSSVQYPQHADLNAFLQRLEDETQNIYRRTIANVQSLTDDVLKAHLDEVTMRAKQVEVITLFDFIPKYIEERKNNPRKDKRGTNKILATWANILTDFQQYRRKDFSFDDIDYGFLAEFESYCYNQKGHSINYTAKGISIVKQFINEGRRAGLTENRIVNERGFSIRKIETNKIVLYFEDLDAINAIDWDLLDGAEGMSADRLKKVVDLIVIGCYTGMRSSDFKRITPDLIKHFRGNDLIEVFTKKTDTPVAIPLLEPLKEVLIRNDFKAPSASSVEMSRVAKIVCRLAGIDEKVQWRDSSGGKLKIETREKWEVISPHAFRRSFATNFFLMGLPVSTLMKITGHKTERQFMEYVNVGNRLNAEHFAKRMEIMPKFLKAVR